MVSFVDINFAMDFYVFEMIVDGIEHLRNNQKQQHGEQCKDQTLELFAIECVWPLTFDGAPLLALN